MPKPVTVLFQRAAGQPPGQPRERSAAALGEVGAERRVGAQAGRELLVAEQLAADVGHAGARDLGTGGKARAEQGGGRHDRERGPRAQAGVEGAAGGKLAAGGASARDGQELAGGGLHGDDLRHALGAAPMALSAAACT